MVILIDSAEQDPMDFNHPVERKRLGRPIDGGTGDISIKGLEDIVRLERKKADELWGSLGVRHEHFRNQLQRMMRYPVRGLLVEGDLLAFSKKPPYSKMLWQNISSRLMRWTAEFAIPVWFLGPRSKESVLLVEDLLVGIHDLYRRDKEFLGRWTKLMEVPNE